jgi:hypothetical protein
VKRAILLLEAEAGFRVFYGDPRATSIVVKAGSRMQTKPSATCTYPDGREARWANTGAKVDDGTLAPGLVLEDGAIGGVPSAAGTYTVTIKFAGVTCAGKPQGDQRVPVTITVR